MTSLRFNGLVLNERANDRDPVDFLNELPDWDRHRAERLAAAEGIELTESHWRVIQYLRERFMAYGQARNARVLYRQLTDHFAGLGGGRGLYGLFPDGPVSQGSRIAGLPLPPGSEDRNFGSVH